MKRYLLVLLFLGFGIQILQGQQIDIPLGNKFTIHSDILNEDRVCFINLPDTYNNPPHTEKKYPVLILLDGYTFFKTATGIIHLMSSDRNRNYFMPETITVAIENVDRERDFTVTKLKTKRVNTMGGGRRFLNFIEKELIPYIDKHYRTEPHRTLVGHSLGGLLTLNAYMDAHSIFDKYLSIDPSLWWDEKTMQNKVDSISPECFNKRLYIATANQQTRRYERNKKRHDRFYTLMKAKSDGQLHVKVESFDDENHRSVPLIALYYGLKYLNP
ncbi:alpha/beta hydrolase-fold protein [Seonamhaeicola sp.]|uniref:alpha/beta hydrolase n=1 Tax=Seonamhaeicola sp. TaxID=1912245 RepID=UPI002635BA1E|nr:alpha/beta hydrolase-fold protein [Seonamhaeicola sp.]